MNPLSMNPLQIMKQAKELNDRLQEQMGQLRVEATAGGGMVTVVLNGHKHVQQIRIDPEVVSKDDVEMLQDLIAAAINDGNRKVDEELKRNVGGLMGGLSIPGLM
jgi:DNA-binding YbaB/EbfC family protein